MADNNNYKNFLNGISIIPKNPTTNSNAGEVEVDSVTGKQFFYNGTELSNSAVVTEKHASQGANRLTNKDLEDITFKVVASADTTKKIGWSVAGATSGKTLTLASLHQYNQSINIPTLNADGATDTFVLKDLIQTINNKSLSSPTIDNIKNLVSIEGVGSNDITFNSNLTSATGKGIKFVNNSKEMFGSFVIRLPYFNNILEAY